jgi:hypothetical protein
MFSTTSVDAFSALVVPIIYYVLAEIFAYFSQQRAAAVHITVQVLNVVSQPMFFYILLYDPAVTYQPSWFKWLG